MNLTHTTVPTVRVLVLDNIAVVVLILVFVAIIRRCLVVGPVGWSVVRSYDYDCDCDCDDAYFTSLRFLVVTWFDKTH